MEKYPDSILSVIEKHVAANPGDLDGTLAGAWAEITLTPNFDEWREALLKHAIRQYAAHVQRPSNGRIVNDIAQQGLTDQVLEQYFPPLVGTNPKVRRSSKAQ
jgi:hypothetical protein